MNEHLDILRSVFGFDSYRGSQEDIIRHTLGGGDSFVLMPTGGGKSLCYQLPALCMEAMAVVISPLIALMHDQVDSLCDIGVKAAYLNSSLSAEEFADVENRVRKGDVEILYLAPERLLRPDCLSFLEGLKICLFAIDEAHCVNRWGHDFRPEYLRLEVLGKRFPGVPRMALTATADQRSREEIVARLELKNARQFISGFDRPNIRYRITLKETPKQQLLEFLREEHTGDCGIIYCLSRKSVESLSAWLCGKGYVALPYHAGLPAEMRNYHQSRFLKEDGVIIVATIAFGMGIDKPDVRFVAHMDLPKSIEAYYQETGRAGRDGKPADAWMVYGLQDVIKIRNMLDASDAADEFKRVERAKIESLLGFCEITSCRRQALLAYFDDHLEKPCGNCDTCLEPVDKWDGTEAARKGLSCIYRTGQRFGVGHLIDVLRGISTERVVSLGHDSLSTFGIGTELGETEWRGVFRQLIAQGYAEVDHESFGAIRISSKAKELLRGNEKIYFRKDAPRRDKNKFAARSPSKSVSTWSDELDSPKEVELFDALRKRRAQIAEEQGIPAFRVFQNSTLVHMVKRRPSNKNEFRRISGVGERKLAQYAEDFLCLINGNG